MKKECRFHGLQDFILNGKNAKGKQKYRCVVCSRISVNRHRVDYKKKIVNLAGGKCIRCGYDKYIGALQFHHRDPTQKDFTLSIRDMGQGWDQIVEEVKKCDLLCANCHAEVHAGL